MVRLLHCDIPGFSQTACFNFGSVGTKSLAIPVVNSIEMTSFQPPAYPLEFIAHKVALAKNSYHDAETATLIGLAGVVIAFIYWLSSHSRQTYVKGVPFVGGSDEDAIKKNRIRFVNDSKNMLLEGYKQVCDYIFKPISSGIRSGC